MLFIPLSCLLNVRTSYENNKDFTPFVIHLASSSQKRAMARSVLRLMQWMGE